MRKVEPELERLIESLYSRDRDDSGNSGCGGGERACGAEILLEMVVSAANIRRFMNKFKTAHTNVTNEYAALVKDLTIDLPFLSPSLSFNDTITLLNRTAAGYNKYRFKLNLVQSDQSQDLIKQKDIINIVSTKFNALNNINRYNDVKDLFDARYPRGLFNFPGNYEDYTRVISVLYNEKEKRDASRRFKKSADYIQTAQKDIIYQDEYCAVIIPSTYEISRTFFGAPVRRDILDGTQKPGATWCTSSSTDEHFKAYTAGTINKLVYIQKKQGDPARVLYAIRYTAYDMNPSSINRHANYSSIDANILTGVNIKEAQAILIAKALLDIRSGYVAEYEKYKGVTVKNKREYTKIYGSLQQVFREALAELPLPPILEMRDQQNEELPYSAHNDEPELYSLIKKVYGNIGDSAVLPGNVAGSNYINIINFITQIFYQTQVDLSIFADNKTK